jgi:hypothetical protein
MFGLRSRLVRSTISPLLLMVLALEVPAQSHESNHLYAVGGYPNAPGSGFVYLLNLADGSLTHLFPSLLGPSLACNPKTGVWYTTRNIGSPADRPGINYASYFTFNPESQALRIVKTRMLAEDESANGGMAYNPADGDIYLLQGNVNTAKWYLEKLDPPTGKVLGRSSTLVTEHDVAAVGPFTFDNEGSLWALVLRSFQGNGSWELVEFDLASGARIQTLTLAEISANQWHLYEGGLVYDSQKNVFYTYHESWKDDRYFGTIDANTGSFTPLFQLPIFWLAWGP